MAGEKEKEGDMLRRESKIDGEREKTVRKR